MRYIFLLILLVFLTAGPGSYSFGQNSIIDQLQKTMDSIVTVRAGDFADKAVAIIRKHGGFTSRDDIPPDGPVPPVVDYSGT